MVLWASIQKPDPSKPSKEPYTNILLDLIPHGCNVQIRHSGLRLPAGPVQMSLFQMADVILKHHPDAMFVPL